MYHMEKESYQNVQNCTSQMQHKILVQMFGKHVY